MIPSSKTRKMSVYTINNSVPPKNMSLLSPKLPDDNEDHIGNTVFFKEAFITVTFSALSLNHKLYLNFLLFEIYSILSSYFAESVKI